VAGGNMKEKGFDHWDPPNVGATNEGDFTALPGGYYDEYYQEVKEKRKKAYFWTQEPQGDLNLYSLSYDTTNVRLMYGISAIFAGCSVRCLKD
jgi:uncharacterized protein (TIGR02145 family)